MKKRLFLLPLCACIMCSCGPTQGTQEEKKEPDPVIHTKTLTGIEVSNPPTTVNYKEGETFNPSGMVVNAVYDDGTKEVVTNYQIPNQALTVGMTSITITYNGKTAQIDITVTAVPKYTVTFMANATDKIADVIYKEGETPSYSYSIPSTPQYDYTVLGWSLTPNGEVLGTLPEVTQNATYYAVVSQKTRKYAVIFKDHNGSLIETKNLEYGSNIVAPSYTPQDTAQYDYELIGWSLSQGGTKIESFPTVTGEVTYFALVSSTVRKYTVTFFDIDGKQYQSGSLEYGSTPTCDYEVEDTAEWDYTTKWSLTEGGTALASLPKVTENANYHAVTTRVKQKYDISFKNEDGTDYKKVNVEYGSTPTVTAPSKDADQQYTYTFAGWSTTKGGEVLASLPAVTGEATYFAIFKRTLNRYSIKLHLNYGDSDIVITVTDDYGTQYTDFDDAVPEREGYHFAGWCLDEDCEEKVTFPVTLTENVEYYAKWNEKIEVAKFLKALLGIKDYNPYSFVPETMRPNYASHFVQDSDILDFTTEQDVDDINLNCFGEQWQMIIDNMNQSEKFYAVLSAGDSIFTAALTAFINYFEDDAHAGETSHEEQKVDNYDASCSYSAGILTFSLDFKKAVLGFTPKIEMVYAVATAEKIIKISLNDNDVIKCAFTENSYIFGISYGLTISGKTGLRTAYCELNRDDSNNVDGHIYEYFSYINDESSKELLKSSADFYITEQYVSVVGNKASGLVGSEATINELYLVGNGRLIAYEVEEDLEFLFVKSTYHTFWFELNRITGIDSIKATPNGEIAPNKNHHDVYVNGSDKVFKPAYNYVAIKSTSRKYDIEMRTRYYYKNVDGKAAKIEAEIPMMFIQDNNDPNTDFDDFPEDIVDTSKISGGGLNFQSGYLTKLREDHETLIPVFKENKGKVTPEAIIEWLK